MFTVKHTYKDNPFTHVFEIPSFNYQEYSPQQGLKVMEERNLPSRPYQVMVCVYGEYFLYPGDQMFIENKAGKTTVALR